MRNFKHLLFSLIFVPLFASAQKYSNAFLDIGIGARALGMGNAYTARTADATAGYWNPSGYLQLENSIEVGLMHAEYFAGISALEYVGLGFKIDDVSAAGFSYIRFGIDDIPNTLNLVDNNGVFNYDRITTFSSNDNAFIFSYARSLSITGLNVGGNVKLIRRKVGEFANAIGFGIDLSAQYHKENLKLGFILRDATNTFNAWRFNTDLLEETFIASGNEIPENSIEYTRPKAIWAAGYDYKINEKIGVYSEINLDMTFDGKRNVLLGSDFVSIDPRVGVEADYRKMIYVRLGINNFQTQTDLDGKSSLTVQPNLGVGIQLKKVALDYALTNIGDASSLYSNVFSLRIGINKRQ